MRRAADAPIAAPASTRPARPAPVLGLLAATLGVLGLALVALRPGGSPTPRVSVTAVAALAARGPGAPPPTADIDHQGALRSAFQGVRFPSFEDSFGWRTSGARADLLGGRPAMTVFYTSPAAGYVAYTIVGGRPLPQPHGARAQPSAGVRFLGLHEGRRTIVTWQRAGHTFVISGIGVALDMLMRLAQWRYDDTPA